MIVSYTYRNQHSDGDGLHYHILVDDEWYTTESFLGNTTGPHANKHITRDHRWIPVANTCPVPWFSCAECSKPSYLDYLCTGCRGA